MNKALQQQKATVRDFVRAYWSDRRLHEIYAFNFDGNMDFYNACACILGVTDEVYMLHSRPIPGICDETVAQTHYDNARALPGAGKIEQAYLQFGYTGIDLCSLKDTGQIRRNRLSAILRAEIRRRARLQRPVESGGEDKGQGAKREETSLCVR